MALCPWCLCPGAVTSLSDSIWLRETDPYLSSYHVQSPQHSEVWGKTQRKAEQDPLSPRGPRVHADQTTLCDPTGCPQTKPDLCWASQALSWGALRRSLTWTEKEGGESVAEWLGPAGCPSPQPVPGTHFCPSAPVARKVLRGPRGPSRALLQPSLPPRQPGSTRWLIGPVQPRDERGAGFEVTRLTCPVGTMGHPARRESLLLLIRWCSEHKRIRLMRFTALSFTASVLGSQFDAQTWSSKSKILPKLRFLTHLGCPLALSAGDLKPSPPSLRC